jgi:hypothetical protein
MIRFKDIQIPKPCSVEYDMLPGDNTKRFCGSCEKYVYDFRGKNQTYLNDIFTANGNVCGIYYEDQIQKPFLKIQHPFYYSLSSKFLSLLLLIKTLFSGQDTQAASPFVHVTEQISSDSGSIRVVFKNRTSVSHKYELTIFINNILYKHNIDAHERFIFLPDNIQPDDHILVIVFKTKNTHFSSGRKYKTHRKKYRFVYKDTPEIIININNRKQVRIFRRRRTAGVPGNFW